LTTGTINRNADSIGPEDLLRPEIKLLQNTGGETAKAAGAKPGQFYNTMSGEIYTDGFEFVVLDFAIGRVYWGRDVMGDEPPMCSSINANSYQGANGEDCRTCPHLLDNAAMVDAKARREKCTKQYSVFGLLLPNMEPFIFRAPGTSSQSIMALMSRFRFNRACRNSAGGIDYHRFKVAASASEQKTAAGSAWVIRFGDITPFGDQNIEQDLFLMSAQMLGQTVAALPAAPQVPEQKRLEAPAPVQPAALPPEAPKINVIPSPPTTAATPPPTAPRPAKRKSSISMEDI